MAGISWDVNYDEVTMTSSDQVHTFVLHSSSYTDPETGKSNQGYSCIEKYRVYGGPQQPFEYIVLELSKKRLTSLAPLLMDDIRAGLNLVTIYGFGMQGAQFVVTNCKMKTDTWKVTAYSIAEDIRGFTLACDIYMGEDEPVNPNAVYVGGTPAAIIPAIVEPRSQSTFTSAREIKGGVNNVIMAYRTTNNNFNGGQLVFKTGTSMWYIILLLAMRLGCNVWVTNGTMYVIDLSIPISDPGSVPSAYGVYRSSSLPNSEGYWKFEDLQTIFLNKEGVYPYSPTPEQNDILNNVVGMPDPGQEGRNLVKNRVVVSFDQPDSLPDPGAVYKDGGTYTDIIVISPNTAISGITPAASASSSTGYYANDQTSSLGECAASISQFGLIQMDLTISEADRKFAQAIADLQAKYYCDSEQPISFTMRETTVNVNNNRTSIIWSPKFGNNTRISRIVDYSNDLVVSTASNLSPNDPNKNRPAKGMISGWVRNFPEHTTTYTFGEIAPTDMTQNNSVIHTAIGSGGM